MTIINALAYGTVNIVSTEKKGVAFTVNLPVKVTATLKEKKKIEGKIPPELKKLAKKTLKFFSHPEYGIKISVENKIPSGLGSKEASSLAIIFAVSGALAKAHGSINELKIDKYWQEQFLMMERTVIDKRSLLQLCPKKLNFAKLAASFYGGFAITEKREVLRRGEMEGFYLTLKKLKNKSEEEKLLQSELNHCWQEALKGKLYQAMKLNSLIHAPEETKKMLEKGALTTSFSPPYLLGLFRDKKGKFTTINQGVKILQKPKRIYRVNDFLKLEKANCFGLF